MHGGTTFNWEVVHPRSDVYDTSSQYWRCCYTRQAVNDEITATEKGKGHGRQQAKLHNIWKRFKSIGKSQIFDLSRAAAYNRYIINRW